MNLLRNILHVAHTSVLMVLAKLIESPGDHNLFFVEIDLDDDDVGERSEQMSRLMEAESMPLLCEILSMIDHILMTSLMFYMATLSLYIFCRQPNPPVLTSSLKTLKVGYNIQMKSRHPIRAPFPLNY